MQPSFHNWAEDRRLKGLVLLVLALAAVALVSYTYLSVRQAKYADSLGPTTISVDGKGEVTKVSDVATFSFNVHAENTEPAVAQKDAAETEKSIVEYLKEQGVPQTDMKTLNYNLSPQYKYKTCGPDFCPPSSSPTIVGYSVDETIQVKVRDTGMVGDLLVGVGQRGAKDISGLTFTVDDDTDAKAEARAKAVADAKENAQQLADILGVRLVRLTGFWEETGGYPMYDKKYGGDMMLSERAVSPDLPVGENTVTSAVNLTYEIR